MGYYEEVYLKRLNRYGYNYQDRLQNKREENFQRELYKSVYYVRFMYNNLLCEGELTHYKDDETKTLQYLLTKVDLVIPGGTVIEFYNPTVDTVHTHNLGSTRYMVYYDETYDAKGYNRYIMLKMTHQISWTKSDGTTYTSWAYMFGQENNMLKDELKSRSRMDTVYGENLKASFFIMPLSHNLYKDDYLEVKVGTTNNTTPPYVEPYRVTGLDRQSTEGVMFVTIDPIYQYDSSTAPEYSAADGDDAEDFFWLNKGVEPND